MSQLLWNLRNPVFRERTRPKRSDSRKNIFETVGNFCLIAFSDFRLFAIVNILQDPGNILHEFQSSMERWTVMVALPSHDRPSNSTFQRHVFSNAGLFQLPSPPPKVHSIKTHEFFSICTLDSHPPD
ncbi:hypothetical protein L596_028003 [Steinernema carpocapsae]|uniref:Uncharacterized protein n=1 Tax=Steinernema carpocapsae TaxID=34508 RepID=A0A4U5LX69_STECR|nr:hypothetical protein L596_028003 [Steinernema carpocapsae]